MSNQPNYSCIFRMKEKKKDIANDIIKWKFKKAFSIRHKTKVHKRYFSLFYITSTKELIIVNWLYLAKIS